MRSLHKLVSLILLCVTLLSFFSCSQKKSAYKMLSDFIYTYSAEGTIYSPEVAEGEDGYVSEGFCEKLYVFDGAFPENFAVFLSVRSESPSECAFFVSGGASESELIFDMINERLTLLGSPDETIIKKSRGIIFYSTLKDPKRAERIYSEIIRSYT